MSAWATGVFKNWKVWAVVIGVALIAALGAYSMQKFKVDPLQKENAELRKQVESMQVQNDALQEALDIKQKEKDEIRAQVVTVKDTVIKYVPKEMDPRTGEKEKTDVQVDIGQPNLNVMLNGKPYEVPLIVGETSTFQDGKLVLQQSGIMTLDIKTPEVKRNKVRFGPFVEYDSGDSKFDAGIKARKEWQQWDLDVGINQDKDVRAGLQYWF